MAVTNTALTYPAKTGEDLEGAVGWRLGGGAVEGGGGWVVAGGTKVRYPCGGHLAAKTWGGVDPVLMSPAQQHLVCLFTGQNV